MSKIPGSNPEKPRQPEVKRPSGNTPAIIKIGNAGGIFRAKLTREQAKKEGLIDLFNKYNTNNNETIDADEFKVYLQQNPANPGFMKGGATGTGVNFATSMTGAIKPAINEPQGTLDDKGMQKVKHDVAMQSRKVLSACSTINTSANGNIPQRIITSSNTSQAIENVAQDINQNIDTDLDESNENSLINTLAARYKRKEFTPEERELYEEQGIDIDNLSEDEYKELAKGAILAKYTFNMLEPILEAIENNDADLFAKSAQVLMKTNCNTADLANVIIAMAHRAGKSFSEDQIRSMVNTYAETYQHEEGTDEELENIATTDVMTYADEEYIRVLYQNNAQMVDKYNEIAQNVANNTTDETRKSMLNNIVQNSAEIIKNAPNDANKSDNTSQQAESIKNSVIPNAPPVSDPIQNSDQVTYINDLKQQALELQNQFVENTPTDTIPQQLNHAFSTVREYRSFTGSGMTLFEYQETKSTLKNNFTNAINEIVKDYTTMPDVFKTKVLTLFDSLDDNMLGELFINGNQDIHQFMYKYNYMNDTKLLAFAERKPAEFSNASPKIKSMLTEIKEEQAQKTTV